MCAPSPSTAPTPTNSFQDSRLGGADRFHVILLGFGVLALMTGLCGAMWRLGWTLPHGASLAAVHGPLMISGVFGTLIGVERASTLGHRWAYAIPALAGIGSLTLVFGAPAGYGAGAYATAAAALSGATLLVTLRQPSLSTGATLLGALAWLAGNILWLSGQSAPDAVGWWLTFLIATVVGERMELSQSMPRRRGGEALFLFAVGLLIVGARNGIPTGNGAMLFGIALLVTAIWLLRHDTARKDVRGTGQDRYTAACMLAGHAWIAVAGLVLVTSPPGGTFGYDVALHAVLIGFVLSMVFGHALTILPTLARIRVHYTPLLYGALLLLHASVALRVGSGIVGWDAGRKGSGIVTLASLMTFFVSLVLSRRRDRVASGSNGFPDAGTAIGPIACEPR